MIINDKFINWFSEQDSDTQCSVYNFVISTQCSMSIKDRIAIAIEIILGKRFNEWISRNQKSKDANQSCVQDVHTVHK